MLDGVYPLLDARDVGSIRKLDRLLQQDWARVDPLVDEVDGHTGDPDAVLERLLDRSHAWKGRQE